MNRRSKESPKPLPPPTKSEAAFERLLAAFPNGAPADDFVEHLFSRAQTYLKDDPYRNITERASFATKIVGVTFEGRQDVIAGLTEGAPLTLERQPNNPHDVNAVAVHFGNLQLGFLKKELAKRLAPILDDGVSYDARVESLTGGGAKNFGVNIRVRRERTQAERSAVRLHVGAEDDVIVRALLGEHQPHLAQRQVLDRLEAGKNTLAVLGTGRGKSFCFQFVATKRALQGGEKTLVLYPLRALANDQFESLRRRTAELGLRVLRANGSISSEEREELEAALEHGDWDVILATPEFLQFHRGAFSAKSAPAFVVVDEAHHIYESRHRAAYSSLDTLIGELAPKQVFALTATAHEEAFAAIRQALGIDAWVIDPTVRENLELVDARNTADKDAYLADVCASGNKAIVYTNSKSGTVKVAAALRRQCGDVVAFYHAGVPTSERLEIERRFREGELRVVVATSAFGEGIDLPDVRDVVLYHLNFDFTEFNQQAGRAGRDGTRARIHLLFGSKDRNINDYIIEREAPRLPVLREIYRGLRGLAREGKLRMPYTEIARTLELEKADERTIAAAVRIFEDSALVRLGEDEDGRYVELLTPRGKVDMSENERFAEGEAEREAFERFCELVLTASVPTLQNIINRPIYPHAVPLQR